MLRGDHGLRPLVGIGRRPRLLGRDEAADVVIQEPSVSRHHLLIWRTAGDVLVRDVGSALGTRIGGRKLGPGDAMVVGEGLDIVLAERTRVFWNYGGLSVPPPTPAAVVERSLQIAPDSLRESGTWTKDLITGAVASDTLPIGRLGSPGQVSVTVRCGNAGPKEVRFEDGMGHELRVRGESRMVMLYLLADRAVRCDHGEAESPWVEDRTLAIGLWGSRGPQLPSSRLNTVISRVREQLRKANLPPTLLQKESGRTRFGAVAGTIVIEDPLLALDRSASTD